uniref:Uncharacterized protein n=1 Tax=Hyaloperonospora arabidopsidis (strain Emoy2) TaxID=559515 RepID=M4B1F8_HYAAE
MAMNFAMLQSEQQQVWNGYLKTGPEPMDLSLAETDEEAEIRAIEQHRNIRRCFTCGSSKQLRANCPLLRASQATSGRTPAANQKYGTVRET